MDKKISMNFYVERESAMKYSRAFTVARAVIISLPLLYFAYIAYFYYLYSGQYGEANAEIESMQEQLSKYQRELKNSRIVFADFDSSETVLKKGFLFDGEAPFSDTVEAVFSPEMNEKIVKLRDSLAGSVKKIKTGERDIFEGLYNSAEEFKGKIAITDLKLDFTAAKIDFQIKCASKDTLLKLIANIRANRWAGQVFVSTLKSGADDIDAYVMISLKEAELFE